jgi:enoyl-CoA hydratase/carnithine racemase
LERSARTLRKFVDQLVDDYGRVMDASSQEIRQFLADETWFTAKEAVAIGLADRIDESLPRVEPVEGQLVKHYRHAPAALRSNSKAAGTPKRDAAERKAARTGLAKRDSAAFEKALRLVRAQRLAKTSEDRRRYERRLEVAQEAIRQGGDVRKALASVR